VTDGRRIRATIAEELIGWCGAVALLVAFAFAATDVVKTSSVGYLLLNLCGATSLARASFSRRAYSPAVLNVIWALIAALSLIMLVAGA
jgi:hypothetical protein